MLHLLYILAFTVVAFLAVSNLIRSLVSVSFGASRPVRSLPKNYHPELLNERGEPINEPLLVMRAVNMEEARQQLDALYEASPSGDDDR